MKFKKLLLNIFLFIFAIIPVNALAYSNYLIPGGENIGIKVNTKYITIQGFYKVDGEYIGSDAGFKVGDKIVKINDINVNSIKEMISILDDIKDKNNIKITFLRENKEKETTLKLVKDKNGIYKTGLYVKDSITGIGTLTYIDPENNTFASLGHMITDKNTSSIAKIKDGEIFSSIVTGINKSENGNPGEKNARFNTEDVKGNIKSNLEEGIFGTYTGDINEENVLEITDIDNVKKGKAIIKTVVNGIDKEEFEINIIDIDKKSNTKNFLIEITDKDLLDITGGIVAGMSGSPIIQDNKIIGAVTHVVVNDTKKGYGIAIKNMLEKQEK